MNQINFTKGLVIKKHLIVKKPEGSDAEMDDDEDAQGESENVLNSKDTSQ